MVESCLLVARILVSLFQNIPKPKGQQLEVTRVCAVFLLRRKHCISDPRDNKEPTNLGQRREFQAERTASSKAFRENTGIFEF